MTGRIVQPRIVRLITKALRRMTEDGHSAASIYLTDEDYQSYQQWHSRIWQRQLRTTAIFWPLSHEGVPFVNEKALERLAQVPVRQRTGLRSLKSTAYASNGSPYPLELP